jgi:hypothetical protein
MSDASTAQAQAAVPTRSKPTEAEAARRAQNVEDMKNLGFRSGWLAGDLTGTLATLRKVQSDLRTRRGWNAKQLAAEVGLRIKHVEDTLAMVAEADGKCRDQPR